MAIVTRNGFEFRLLGPVEVLYDGRPLLITSTKQRVLLVSLLLNANRVVPVDALIARLWGQDPPHDVRNSLQNHVMRLRRTLNNVGDGVTVVTRPPGYLIEVANERVDLYQLESLATRAKTAMVRGEIDQVSALLLELPTLYRGEPLSDVPSDLLQREAVPILRERWLSAVELRIDAEIAQARHSDITGELRELTKQHPTHERFWAQLMVALHRSGRQAEALECYTDVRALLAEELGIDPCVELQHLHRQILTADPALGDVPRDRSEAEICGNLPAELTTFVGREPQITQAKELLRKARLVTLTGVGGVGKTRLALHVADALARTYRDGVWVTDLAPLTEPELLDRTVAKALGIHDQSARAGIDVLVHHLREKEVLLVLDNCEHMLPAATSLVHELLRAVPSLRVLATSRQLLGVPGEHLMQVPPLTVPDEDDTAHFHQSLLRYEAVALFADRAAASAPGTPITETNPADVARLCRRLDGIPLAIELAAVRLATMSIEDILTRLDDRFRVLTGISTPALQSSHQTLRAVVDWSYDLCSKAEQRLWARLSVFAGEFDLCAAETVCASNEIRSGDVLELLTGLVHKSILTITDHAPTTRYRLLETIRQYGQRRLLDCGENEVLRHRHYTYYRGLVGRAESDWFSTRELTWMDRLQHDLPNIHTALDYSSTQSNLSQSGLEMATSMVLIRFVLFNGIPGQCRHWMDRILAQPASMPTKSRVTAVARAAFIAACQGDGPVATMQLAECRDLARRLDQGDRIPELLFIEGSYALITLGDPGAIPILEQAREEFRNCGQLGDEHMATMLWSMAAALLGDGKTAFTASGILLADAEERCAVWARSWAVWCMGLTELKHGDPHCATAHFRDSLRCQRDIADCWGPVWGLEALGWATAIIDEHEHAAQLMGAAHKLRQAVGVTLDGMRPYYESHAKAEDLVRRALGDQRYTVAFAQGATTDDPIRLALDWS